MSCKHSQDNRELTREENQLEFTGEPIEQSLSKNCVKNKCIITVLLALALFGLFKCRGSMLDVSITQHFRL